MARRKVIDRRMTGLQNPEGMLSFGDSLSGKDNPQMVVDLLETRRSGIIPHRFLAEVRSDTLWPRDHEPTPFPDVWPSPEM
jgi:hypothetical protein